MPREDLIQDRRGTAADWAAADPVLDEGEEGFETDTFKGKTGDGATAWTALPYTSGPMGTAAERNVPASGDAAADEVVLGADTRLGGGGGTDPTVVLRSKPTHASTRTSNVLGSLNNPWTDTVTTDAEHPTVGYEVEISAQASGDELIYVALACDGVVIDRGVVYTAGAGTRENRGSLNGYHTPAPGVHTYEVYFATNGSALTVNSTPTAGTATGGGTADGISSMQLSVGVAPTELSNMFLMIVQHGADAGMTRPDAPAVYWIGSVEPTNAQDQDLYYPTA